MGENGSGKSYAAFQIARKCQSSGSDARFFYINNENGIRKLIGSEFKDLKNITLFKAYTWEDHEQAMIQIMKAKPRENDWIVVDLFNETWELVQNYYTLKVFGSELDDYWLKYRTVAAASIKDSSVNPLDGWQDWPVIKKIYKDFTDKFLLKSGCNIIGITGVDKVNEKTDQLDIIQNFGRFGVRPSGNKKTGHWFDTIIFVKALKPGDHYMTTIKDKGRQPLEGVKITDFAIQYMMARAGWRG